MHAWVRAHLCLDRVEKNLVLLGELFVFGIQERLERRLLLLAHLHQNRLPGQLQVIKQLRTCHGTSVRATNER